jgi:hypothetical protein
MSISEPSAGKDSVLRRSAGDQRFLSMRPQYLPSVKIVSVSLQITVKATGSVFFSGLERRLAGLRK